MWKRFCCIWSGAPARGDYGVCSLLPDGNVSEKELTVVRPLLEVRRDETGEYCSSFHLQPRQDAYQFVAGAAKEPGQAGIITASDRVIIPGIMEALQRTAHIAGDDIAHLEKEAARYWPKVAAKQGDVILLDKKALLKLPISCSVICCG